MKQRFPATDRGGMTTHSAPRALSRGGGAASSDPVTAWKPLAPATSTPPAVSGHTDGSGTGAGAGSPGPASHSRGQRTHSHHVGLDLTRWAILDTALARRIVDVVDAWQFEHEVDEGVAVLRESRARALEALTALGLAETAAATPSPSAGGTADTSHSKAHVFRVEPKLRRMGGSARGGGLEERASAKIIVATARRLRGQRRAREHGSGGGSDSHDTEPEFDVAARLSLACLRGDHLPRTVLGTEVAWTANVVVADGAGAARETTDGYAAEVGSLSTPSLSASAAAPTRCAGLVTCALNHRPRLQRLCVDLGVPLATAADTVAPAPWRVWAAVADLACSADADFRERLAAVSVAGQRRPVLVAVACYVFAGLATEAGVLAVGRGVAGLPLDATQVSVVDLERWCATGRAGASQGAMAPPLWLPEPPYPLPERDDAATKIESTVMGLFSQSREATEVVLRRVVRAHVVASVGEAHVAATVKACVGHTVARHVSEHVATWDTHVLCRVLQDHARAFQLSHRDVLHVAMVQHARHMTAHAPMRLPWHGVARVMESCASLLHRAWQWAGVGDSQPGSAYQNECEDVAQVIRYEKLSQLVAACRSWRASTTPNPGAPASTGRGRTSQRGLTGVGGTLSGTAHDRSGGGDEVPASWTRIDSGAPREADVAIDATAAATSEGDDRDLDCSAAHAELAPPPVPPGCVLDRGLRQRELALLVDKLTGQDSLVVNVAGLKGEGGVGKSVLAAAAAGHYRVLSHFSDGVFWVHVGQDKPDIPALQTSLCRALGAEPGSAMTRAANGAHRAAVLGAALRRRRCLVVLDDVWQKEHLGMFVHGSDWHRGGSRALVSTRDAAVLSAGGAAGAGSDDPNWYVMRLDSLDEESAVSLLMRARAQAQAHLAVIESNRGIEGDERWQESWGRSVDEDGDIDNAERGLRDAAAAPEAGPRDSDLRLLGKSDALCYARAVANRVGNLPLALTIVAKHAGDARLTWQECFDSLVERPGQLLAAKSDSSGAPTTAAAGSGATDNADSDAFVTSSSSSSDDDEARTPSPVPFAAPRDSEAARVADAQDLRRRYRTSLAITNTGDSPDDRVQTVADCLRMTARHVRMSLLEIDRGLWQRYLALSMLPRGMAVPVSLLRFIWRDASDRDTCRRMDRLVALSLCSAVSRAEFRWAYVPPQGARWFHAKPQVFHECAIKLHDLQHDFALSEFFRMEEGIGGVRRRHARLLQRLGDLCEGGPWEYLGGIPTFPAWYCWAKLPWLMRAATPTGAATMELLALYRRPAFVFRRAHQLHGGNMMEVYFELLDAADGLRVTRAEDNDVADHWSMVRHITTCSNWMIWVRNLMGCWTRFPTSSSIDSGSRRLDSWRVLTSESARRRPRVSDIAWTIPTLRPSTQLRAEIVHQAASLKALALLTAAVQVGVPHLTRAVTLVSPGSATVAIVRVLTAGALAGAAVWCTVTRAYHTSFPSALGVAAGGRLGMSVAQAALLDSSVGADWTFRAGIGTVHSINTIHARLVAESFDLASRRLWFSVARLVLWSLCAAAPLMWAAGELRPLTSLGLALRVLHAGVFCRDVWAAIACLPFLILARCAEACSHTCGKLRGAGRLAGSRRTGSGYSYSARYGRISARDTDGDSSVWRALAGMDRAIHVYGVPLVVAIRPVLVEHCLGQLIVVLVLWNQYVLSFVPLVKLLWQLCVAFVFEPDMPLPSFVDCAAVVYEPFVHTGIGAAPALVASCKSLATAAGIAWWEAAAASGATTMHDAAAGGTADLAAVSAVAV